MTPGLSARSRITGTGHYVPEKVLTNRDLEARVDTTDAWIMERTGIRERRIAADGECTSDMAAAAARRALEAAELSATDLDLIIVATVTPDMPLPSTAVFVQTKIGARSDCPAFDLAAACGGFCYGLTVADRFIRGGARHVLVIGVELLSRVIDWSDRTTCVLFGDGAGAAILSATDDPARGLLSMTLHADGHYASALRIPGGGSAEPVSERSLALRRHFVEMNGREIFKAAVKNLASASLRVLEDAGVSPTEVDWVVPHQANLRILDAVAERSGIARERFYLNLERYGNTSSASIPIALDEAIRGGSITRGQSVLMCALGGGVAWGAVLMRW